MARVSLRGYAKHRGCVLSAVQKAIKTGRIPKGEDGLIDVEAADAAWAANTNVAKAPPVAAAPAPPADPPLLSGELIAAPPMKGLDWPEWPNWKPVENRPPAVGERGQLIPPDAFMAAKTRREQAEAELAEAKVKQARGELVSADLARKMLREIGRIYAGARVSLASEIAPKVVGLTDPNEVERRVKQVVVAVDERIANEIAAKYAEVVVDHVERSGAAV